ncbi:MAG: hypothetical protein H0X45_16080 [Planctomycetes bacterium]|nr:hypothetical protein [Planctomycetota bacterium]
MRSAIVGHATVAQAQVLIAEFFCGAARDRPPFPGRRVRLGELVAVRHDYVDPRTLGTRAIDYIGLEAIEPDTGRLLGATRVAATAVRSRSRVFRAGDVLYGRLRPALNKVLAVPDALAHGICSNEFIVLTPLAGAITPHLLARLLRLPTVRDALAGRTTGSALPRLQADSLLALEIPAIAPRLQQKLEQALIAEESRWRDLRSLLAQYNGHLDAMLTRAIHDGRASRPAAISAALTKLGKAERAMRARDGR